jgi:hypothetical protein
MRRICRLVLLEVLVLFDFEDILKEISNVPLPNCKPILDILVSETNQIFQTIL